MGSHMILVHKAERLVDLTVNGSATCDSKSTIRPGGLLLEENRNPLVWEKELPALTLTSTGKYRVAVFGKFAAWSCAEHGYADAALWTHVSAFAWRYSNCIPGNRRLRSFQPRLRSLGSVRTSVCCGS